MIKFLFTIFILFNIFIYIYAFNEFNNIDNIDKLSSNETINLLKQIYNCQLNESNFKLNELFNKLINKLNLDFNKTSYYSKFTNLITFYNIITLVTIAVFVSFIISLFNDIILFVNVFIFGILIVLFFNMKNLKILGILTSSVMMFFKTSPFYWTNFMFIFDEFTSLLGFILFGITIYLIIHGYKVNDVKKLWINIQIIIGFILTFYHNHWILGFATILLIYIKLGFFTKSIDHGIVFGFEKHQQILNCYTFSFIIIPIFIALNLFNIDIINAFEMGIYFWSTFVGLLSLLILSDRQYIKSLKYNNFVFLAMALNMLITCLILMNIGTLLNIECMKNISGTFLVIWFMNMQRIMITEFKNTPMTLILFLVFANLYGVRYWMKNYPDYFIF
jgi:hypothetical protein